MHRACAALAVVTALLGSGEVEMFAQRVEQRRTRVQVEVPHTTVDGHCDLRVLRRDLGVLLINNGGYAHSQLTFFSGPFTPSITILCEPGKARGSEKSSGLPRESSAPLSDCPYCEG